MYKRALLLAALTLCTSCQKFAEFHDFMALRVSSGVRGREVKARRRCRRVRGSHSKHPVSKVTTFFIARSGGGGVSVRMSNMYVGHLRKP
jgi:hypothetical protein